MISKLKWNKAWSGLGPAPVQDDDAIAKDYARLVAEIDGVRGVWATLDGRTLTVLTLIEEDKDVERRVYRTELAVHERWPDAQIRFHVYRDEEPLLELVRDVPPILIEV